MDVAELITTMHRDLGNRVDVGFKSMGDKMSNHEVSDAKEFGKIYTELNELQNTRKTLRWFIGIVTVALVGGVVEHYINHRTPDVLPVVHAAEPRR